MDDGLAQRISALTSSPLFPFDGELRLKDLSEPMEAEFPRDGEGDQACRGCEPLAEDRRLWANQTWRLTTIRPSANPVGLFLETNEHLDFEDFDDAMAAEYGVITRHLEAAIRSLPSVGRVHIHRWGDGSSHFHVWFQGRPARQLEMHGWGNVLWPQLLEPLPKDVIKSNHQEVVERFTASIAASGI